MDKKDKTNSEKLNTEKNNDANKTQYDPLQFFIGIILLGIGLFMLSKRVIVHSGWYIWRIGSFDLSSGTVVIPLIIGIIWYFANPKSIASKIIITLGVMFIVATIIMSVRISFVTTSMFDYVLILVMAAAGAGLLLKNVFAKRN